MVATSAAFATRNQLASLPSDIGPAKPFEGDHPSNLSAIHSSQEVHKKSHDRDIHAGRVDGGTRDRKA